jgi:DNA-binding LytR/AlgR family response regulator
VRAALSGIEARLDPARFARIHRSAIVRLDQVRAWKAGDAGDAVVVLRDGTELPVSRRRLAQVKALLRQ